MAKRVIVWGSYVEYDRFHQWMEVELLKGSMQIEAIVLNEENLFTWLDGIEVIPIEELLTREYDYLINLNQNDPLAVRRILELLRIPLDKVIPIKVFALPCFDLQRYLAVKESRVSIIANNCWGGVTYNALGMQFLSPFINMFVLPEDYLKLLNRFDFYMDQPLHYIEDGFEVNLKRNYPIVGLADVTLNFNHYTEFESAVQIWEKRKARLNFDNLFVEMIIDTRESLEAFLKVPFARKIGLSTIKCSDKDIIYFPVVDNGYTKKRYVNVWDYFNHMASLMGDELKQYDILKLLNGEEDFMRAGMREQ